MKLFYSYIKNKGWESEGVSSLIDKKGFLQMESTITAEVLNHQFVSAFTQENIESIPKNGPSPLSVHAEDQNDPKEGRQAST